MRMGARVDAERGGTMIYTYLFITCANEDWGVRELKCVRWHRLGIHELCDYTSTKWCETGHGVIFGVRMEHLKRMNTGVETELTVVSINKYYHIQVESNM